MRLPNLSPVYTAAPQRPQHARLSWGMLLLWLTVALLLSPNTWAQSPAADAPTASNRIGTIKDIKGETWVGPADARRPLQSGQGVQEADRLSTGPQGAASLILRDGTVLTLGPNTTADLSKFQYNSTTQEGSFAMNLLQGSVRVVTGLLAKLNPSMFNITTPTSVVGVRGTDFIVEAEAAK